jgi:CelD/BcsL family acetyltransferase involved in cellulose biosynthesis
MSLRIEIVTDAPRLLEIEQPWQTLWGRCGADVFQSHAWISAWWSAVRSRPGVKLRIATAWHGDELVAVLPLAIQRERFLRTLRWAGELFSDYCDALIDTHREGRAVLQRLWEEIAGRGGYDVASLKQVRTDARAAWLLRHLCEQSSRSTMEPGARCLQVRRRWPDGAAFFRSLGKKGRNNHSRGKRILAELGGEVTFGVRGPGEPVEDLIDRLMTLKLDWVRANDAASPLLGEDGEVLRALLRTIAASGALTLFTLECGGKLAAASANFVGRDRNQAYLTSYDPAFSRASPGTILIELYTMWSFDRGFAEVDFLRGDEAFKLGFANAETALMNVVAPGTALGRAAIAARGWRARAKEIAPAVNRLRPAASDAARPADVVPKES